MKGGDERTKKRFFGNDGLKPLKSFEEEAKNGKGNSSNHYGGDFERAVHHQ
jgi:hypothetical protein